MDIKNILFDLDLRQLETSEKSAKYVHLSIYKANTFSESCLQKIFSF